MLEKVPIPAEPKVLKDERRNIDVCGPLLMM